MVSSMGEASLAHGLHRHTRCNSVRYWGPVKRLRCVRRLEGHEAPRGVRGPGSARGARGSWCVREAHPPIHARCIRRQVCMKHTWSRPILSRRTQSELVQGGWRFSCISNLRFILCIYPHSVWVSLQETNGALDMIDVGLLLVWNF